ncbi:MAG: hypothetical protein JXA93_00750, partial [Anaerolineae bacterium]|nr:hypothetical protein [Anaerolineae bacterium]
VQRAAEEPAPPPEGEQPVPRAEAAPPELPLRPAAPPVQRAVKEPAQPPEGARPGPRVEAAAPEGGVPGTPRPGYSDSDSLHAAWPEEERTAQEPAAIVQRRARLSARIVARAEARKRLPLIDTGGSVEKPAPARASLPLPGTLPLREAVVQRATSPGEEQAWTAPEKKDRLPLASLPAEPERARQQGTEGVAGLISPGPGAYAVQRVVEDTVMPGAGPEGEEERSPLDLDELAREVYPYIKRLLAVERERVPRFR